MRGLGPEWTGRAIEKENSKFCKAVTLQILQAMF
jgi:hypothetical protein